LKVCSLFPFPLSPFVLAHRQSPKKEKHSATNKISVEPDEQPELAFDGGYKDPNVDPEYNPLNFSQPSQNFSNLEALFSKVSFTEEERGLIYFFFFFFLSLRGATFSSVTVGNDLQIVSSFDLCLICVVSAELIALAHDLQLVGIRNIEDLQKLVEEITLEEEVIEPIRENLRLK
jgi:hypothetical protein